MRHRAFPLALALAVTMPAIAAARDDAPGERVDLARRHFQSGTAYFEEKRYDEAVREFQESYRLAPRVDLLYNIARTFHNKGDAARAIEFYQQYLGASPAAPDRVPIERTIEELKARIGRVRVVDAPDGADVLLAGFLVGKAPLVVPVAATVGAVKVDARLADGSVRSTTVTVEADKEVVATIPPAPVRVIEHRWWDSRPGWIFAGLGAAALVAGAVVAGPVAQSRADGASSATTESGWRAAGSDARTVQTIGVAAIAAGAFGLAAGAALFIRQGRGQPWRGRASALRAPTIAAWVLPSGGGIAAGGSF